MMPTVIPLPYVTIVCRTGMMIDECFRCSSTKCIATQNSGIPHPSVAGREWIQNILFASSLILVIHKKYLRGMIKVEIMFNID